LDVAFPLMTLAANAQVNEEQAIVVREPDAALHLTSQHNQFDAGAPRSLPQAGSST
jgi:hypothetical protein